VRKQAVRAQAIWNSAYTEMMMSEALRNVPVVKAATVLTLKARSRVSRPDLEEATLHVEQILDEHAADLAPGASACADFGNDTIEIDMTLTGAPAELHQQLAVIIDTLERHNALEIHGDQHNQLVLTSSTTRLAQPGGVAA
jgi:hypothetical protein